MQKRYLLTIVLTLVAMIIFFWRDQSELRDSARPPVPTNQVARLDTEKKSEEVIKKQLIDSDAIKAKASVAAHSAGQKADVNKLFSAHLKLMGQCLEIDASGNSELVEPTFDNLVVALQPSLGEVVVKMDDWSQSDVRSPNGDMKRIRTEVEYVDNNNPVKRAQLYKLNEQGMPELQELSEDVSVDPTDEYLESLRGDGVTTNEEKGGRVYYSEGEELVLVERNGQLQSFSLSKGEKTFSCTETDAPTSNCQCL